jgi:hypothetical protein
MSAPIGYTEMLDYIDDVPDAGNALLAKYLGLVCREFCAKSRIWRHTVDELDVDVDDAVVRIPGIAEAEVAGIMTARLSGEPLSPMRPQDAENFDIKRVGRPMRFWSLDHESIRLWPTPDATYIATLTCTVWLRPALGASSLPAWIFENNLLTIVDGLRWRLYEMPQKPWTNPAQAENCRVRFEMKCNEVSTRAGNGNVSAPARTKAHWM